jgi:fermentation-respiration switch protein FrsA (DUF1100 family)
MIGYRLVGVIVVGYLFYSLLLFALQRHVLFPRHAIGPSPAVMSADAQVIWLSLPDGPVEAWFLPPLANAAQPFPLVIFAHGNAELIDDFPEELQFFRHMGMGLLLVEYPGYGRSAGRPSQQAITATFIRAYDQAVQWPRVDRSRIVFFGRSLGGGVVCALARQRRPAAMILMSAFTGVQAFTARYLLPGFLVRDPFDNIAALKAYDGPVLIIHGNRDEMIPYHHALALNKACSRSQLVTVPCGHNDFAPGWYNFQADVATFSRQAGLLAPLAVDRSHQSTVH